MKWRSRRWLYPDDGDMRFRTYLRAAYQRPGGAALLLAAVVLTLCAGIADGSASASLLVAVVLLVVLIGYAVWRRGVTHG